MRRKNKKIQIENLIKKLCPKYNSARTIKDIDNNNKHKPKGQRSHKV